MAYRKLLVRNREGWTVCSNIKEELKNLLIDLTSVKLKGGELLETNSFLNNDKSARDVWGTIFVSIPPHWFSKLELESKLHLKTNPSMLAVEVVDILVVTSVVIIWVDVSEVNVKIVESTFDSVVSKVMIVWLVVEYTVDSGKVWVDIIWLMVDDKILPKKKSWF